MRTDLPSISCDGVPQCRVTRSGMHFSNLWQQIAEAKKWNKKYSLVKTNDLGLAHTNVTSVTWSEQKVHYMYGVTLSEVNNYTFVHTLNQRGLINLKCYIGTE